MTKKTAIITGASAGVGKAAAQQLLALGWRVIGVGRDAGRCAAAEAELANPDFTMLRADLSSLTATAALAREITSIAPRIDALCNNAGGVSAARLMTAEGIESTWASNQLAPYLLTMRLMPCFVPGTRVIAVSSTGHEQCAAINWDDINFEEGWASGRAYCQAKLGNILFTRELARRFGGEGIIAHAMHPGVVDSNFSQHCEPGMKAYMDSIQDRSVAPDYPAKTLVWLASGDLSGHSNGGYFHAMQPATASVAAMDDAAAARLWNVSAAMTADY